MRLSTARHAFQTAALFAAVIAATASAAAETTRVDSVNALRDAASRAAPGDVVEVKDGRYNLPKSFSLSAMGKPEKPVTITAETAGGVEFRGDGGLGIDARSAHLVVRGFVLHGAAGRTTIPAGAHDIQLTRLTFACEGEGAYLTVSGDNVQIDHCEFRDKHTLGNMVSVTGRGSQVARRLWIHHNYFHDFRNAGGNGAETIRFGLSGLSMSTGDGLVEQNLFVRCTGENELISNKSCGNTYRYNTFLDSPGAQLTLRHGNDCRVYANIFRGMDGLRVFGDRHLIFSNYFEGNTRAINLGNGDGEVADGAKLTSHDRPDNCTFEFNTLVNNRQQVEMDPRKNGLGATRTTFSYNLIQGGEVAARLSGPHPETTWRGNVVWDAGAIGDIPADGYTRRDPTLRPDANGIFRPDVSSPIIAAAPAGFAEVAMDLDGQARPSVKSIGADEPSTAPAIAHLLQPREVGPTAP